MTDNVPDPASKVELAAVAFLRAYAPAGPWCLTAIAPDGGGIETRTFSSETGLLEWVREYNETRHWGIYFHVNPVIGNLTKKAERQQIAAVTYLHVDVDPKKGVDLDGEQQRILGLLTTGLRAKGLPVPTFVTFSGGGYQAFWKLDTPIEIGGDLAKAEDAKLYNKQLEVIFGADNCHNIDRIMRLPGTMNWPKKAKRDAGRVPAMARVVQHNAAAVYPLTLFSKTVPTSSDLPAHEQAAVDVGNVFPVRDLNDLPIDDRLKRIIAEGEDTESPKPGDNSRSAWLFDVCVNLVRAEVPPGIIYSIITDPDWSISASVLAQGRGADAYAKRQIARAQLFAIDPNLAEMNDRYFCVMVGGKFRVATIQRGELIYMAEGDFKKKLATRTVVVGKDKDGKPITSNAAEWWLGHERRRQYEAVGFDPSGTLPGDWFNLWSGFACDARPGSCEHYKDMLLNVICAGDKGHFHYLWRWMAWKVQHPGLRNETAVVLQGEEGAGKGTFAREFGALFGRHFFHALSEDQVTGRFNSHLQQIGLLFADEAFFAGDPKGGRKLKGLITEPSLSIEAKGVDIIRADNCLSIIMASNDPRVVAAGKGARRFFVLKVSASQKGKKQYWDAITAEMRDGGREALLHELRTLDLGDWHPRNDMPETRELAEQKGQSLGPIESWAYQALMSGEFDADGSCYGRPFIEKQKLLDHLNRVSRMPLGRNDVRRVLVPLGWNGDVRSPGSDRRAVYVAPLLGEGRSEWDRLQFPANWPEDVQTWAPDDVLEVNEPVETF